MPVGERVSKQLLYYCNTMPLSFTADQRKIVFRKRIMCTNNAVLSTLARVLINDTVAMSSLYHVHSLRISVPSIENAVSTTFVDSLPL